MNLLRTVLVATTLISFSGNALAGAENPIKLVSSTKDESIIRISVSDFTKKQVVVNGNTEVTIEAASASAILKKGSPDLPKFTVSLVVPNNAQMAYEIVSSSYVDHQNISVAPSKGTLSRKDDPKDIPYVKGVEYNTNKFFPSELASLADTYILRDYTGQSVSVYPFQYNPKTKVLRVYNDLVIRVYQKNKGSNPFVQKQELNSVSAEFLAIYNQHFLNFQSAVPSPPLGEQGKMLIICNDAYLSAMAPFVAWKKQIGIPTTIVGISTVGNTTAAISSYVTNYYNTEGLTYLLIVGDAQHVTPMFFTNSGDSDNGYSYILGNDKYPDIIVGRFSAESIADVNTQVNRTISYEKNPTLNATWYKNGMGIASSQGPGDDGQMDFQHEHAIRSQLLAYTYTTVSEMYDGSQGFADAPGNPTPAMIAADVNNGLGIINYTGHGSNTSWASSGFSSSNIPGLTNYNKWPFIFSVACVNGNFKNLTCFAESWLRATNSGTPTGAIAVMMSTINQYWNEPMEGQDQMDTILAESYVNNIKRSFGGIAFNGMIKMNDKYGQSGFDMTDTWTLFGDPSVVVRTDAPSLMAVTHSTLENVGLTQLVVNCNKNGAMVSLNLQGNILGTGIVSSGSVAISFPAINAIDSIDVTVTAYNAMPYFGKTYIQCPAQLMNLNTTNGTICKGDSIVLSSTGASNYTWTPNSAMQIYSPSSVKVSPSATTIYTVMGTLNSVCFETVNITVNVNALPNVTFNQNPSSACVNQSAVTLIGQPAGGVFSGNGVVGNTFDPPTAGTGNHSLTYTYTDANNCSNTANTTFVVAACTGLTENQNAQMLEVYPNPASDAITIKNINENVQLSIYNSLGEIITVIDAKKEMSSMSINTRAYARGVYFLRIGTGEGSSHVKFILN
jgi:hypothetical protein